MTVCTVNVITMQFYVISGTRVKAVFPVLSPIRYIYSAKG